MQFSESASQHEASYQRDAASLHSDQRITFKNEETVVVRLEETVVDAQRSVGDSTIIMRVEDPSNQSQETIT